MSYVVDTVSDQKIALILATAENAVFEGWQSAALHQAADNLGLSDTEADLMFPGGMIDVIEEFINWADCEMEAKLQQQNISHLKIRDRIALAVRTRFEVVAPYKEACRLAATTLALPANHLLALRRLYASVDRIWFVIGDRSTDYNFYSKRLLLSGVFASTFAFWLSDDSHGCHQTWHYLDRRIKDVLMVGGQFGKIVKSTHKLPNIFQMLARLKT